MRPLISVIVPVYKVELYLRQCLDSILAQTYHNLEIILVDDGSPDHCGVICDEYAQKDSRICVIHKENGGLSDARNAGVEAAQGEYIGFVDSDDWISPNMYEALYQAAETYCADIAVCEYYDCWSKRCYASHQQEIGVFDGENGIRALLELKIANYACNKLYRRELFAPNVRYPVGKAYEDVRTMYKLFRKCRRVVTVPEIGYYYRRHSESITGSGQLKNRIEAVLSRAERFEEISESYPLQRDFMLKNTFEYVFPLRTALCKENGFVTYREEMSTVTAFLRKYETELFKIYNYGKLGRLSYHFMRRDSQFAWRLSRKVDAFWRLKEKCAKTEFVKRWNSTIENIKMYGKRSYYYGWCMHLPLTETIFIESRGGEDLGGNMFQIAQEACRRRIKVYISVKPAYLKKVKTILETGEFTGAEVVVRKTKKYFNVFATSRYLFTDMVFDFEWIKRQGQIFVNTWHGTPLKMLEFDIKNQRHSMGGGSRDHLKCDYLALPSQFLFETLLCASRIEPLFGGKALYCGYPRNSIFFDENLREKTRQKMELTEKEVFAYMPTWRDSTQAVIYKEYSLKRILDFFEAKLKDDQIVFVNLHNYTKENVDYSSYQKVRAFPKDIDTYKMLNAADCLITDYSSVLFDYANARKKIILFTYDRAEYLKNRGLYFSLEDMPFPKVSTYDALERELNIQKTYDDTEFINRFCSFDCKDSVKKLFSAVVDKENVCVTETVNSDNKKNILLYDAQFILRELTDEPAKQLIKALDTNSVNVFYCYRQQVLNKTPQYLLSLPPKVKIIALTYDVNYTLGEKVITKLSGGKVRRVRSMREWKRQFGEQTFDEIWMLGKNENDPFCQVLQKAAQHKEIALYDCSEFKSESGALRKTCSVI